MDIFVKRQLEADVFLMYDAARGLENARQRAEESEDNKEYWEKVVRFWERKLDRSIDLVKVTYHLYLKS